MRHGGKIPNILLILTVFITASILHTVSADHLNVPGTGEASGSDDGSNATLNTESEEMHLDVLKGRPSEKFPGYRYPQVPLDVENYPIGPDGLELEQVHIYVRHGKFSDPHFSTLLLLLFANFR